jgi:hypothetical protein
MMSSCQSHIALFTELMAMQSHFFNRVHSIPSSKCTRGHLLEHVYEYPARKLLCLKLGYKARAASQALPSMLRLTRPILPSSVSTP